MTDPLYTVRVPLDIQAKMRHVSRMQSRSHSAVVAEALSQYLEKFDQQLGEVDLSIRLPAGRPRHVPWPEDSIVVVE